MKNINRTVVLAKFGIPTSASVKWTRSYLEDTLEVHDSSTDDLTVLCPTHIKEMRSQAIFSISPTLLSLGATFTNIVDIGEQPLVFVPAALEDIPEEALSIRGYLI